MYNRDKTGLLIFDNFQIDFNLPKWRSEKRNPDKKDARTMEAMQVVSRTFVRFDRIRTSMATGGTLLNPTATMNSNAAGSSAGISGGSAQVPTPSQSEKSKSPSLFDRIFHRKKLKRLHEENEERKREQMEMASRPNFTVETIAEPTQEISVSEFFTGIKGTAEELQLATERFKNYEAAVGHLKKTGQTALLEMMEHQLEIHSAETRLFGLGMCKVVTEKNLVDFSAKSSRDLCLDWIKNFARSIPSKVVDVKMKADENEVFDNYVILHYNPMKNGKMLTVKEWEDANDPILFGVIAGSNKLYYLADWTDEYCDLTFDKLVEKIGADAITANDLTVQVHPVVE